MQPWVVYYASTLYRYKANVASQDAAPPGLMDLEEELDEAVGLLAKKLTGNWTVLENQVRQVRLERHTAKISASHATRVPDS